MSDCCCLQFWTLKDAMYADKTKKKLWRTLSIKLSECQHDARQWSLSGGTIGGAIPGMFDITATPT
jgi:hypothetical protein